MQGDCLALPSVSTRIYMLVVSYLELCQLEPCYLLARARTLVRGLVLHIYLVNSVPKMSYQSGSQSVAQKIDIVLTLDMHEREYYAGLQRRVRMSSNAP